ncbi:fimbrial protein [Rahnella victoriana]|uniref:fimbrial protein n=1 Tax=Rahnella victoriana TaxID=1510570 RepID=UPI00103A1954|nr:fimbrial protein [Rahnella victoriana]TBX32309.1 type 1 fimbrial protein [Rahnella victoriana]UHM93216.1 type 1 fimbrial protein [Rahnella victoriana]
MKDLLALKVLRILLLALASLWTLPVIAGVSCTSNPATATLTATIPAVSTVVTVGSPGNRYLTDWFSAPASGYSSLYTGCVVGNITLQGKIALQPAGSSIDGYAIFKTNVDGIGIIVQGRNRNNTGPALGTDWVDIITGSTSYWDGSFTARLVSTTTTIQSGSVTLPGTIGYLRIVDKNDVAGSSTIIPVNLVVSGSMTFTSQTCTVSANSKNIGVSLGKVNSNAITTGGSSLVHSPFTINLDSCSVTSGLSVNMTFTDNNNPANTSNILSLTNDGKQATGLGIRIINQATQQPVSYGPDSAVVGNPGQFRVTTTTGGSLSIPFMATYIKSGSEPIVGGTANGVATYTMSYQ